LRLLLDEMLSPAIARELRGRGHDVEAIKEHPEWEALPDADVVLVATGERRVIVTSNVRDFRVLHAELVASRTDYPGMIFIPVSFRLTKAATGRIVAALEQLLAEHPDERDLAGGEAWV
jgi:predicted nuclease of predicted toxin-antitoxin system